MKLKKESLLVFFVLLIISLTGCDFGGQASTSTSDIGVVTEVRTLPADFTNRKAISYSGYRDGQSPDEGIYPSEANILEDLNMLNSMGFSLLRLYDTTTHAKRVLKVIDDNNLDMKVMLGVWISGARDTYNGANIAVCDQAVIWANGVYSDIIVAISIGNETMVDWNTFGWATPAADIGYYVTYVRNQVTQPITVDDNWEPWSLEDESGTIGPYGDVHLVAKAVDFIAIHTYPIFDAAHGLWDFVQVDYAEGFDRADAMMDASVEYAKENYLAVKNALSDVGVNKPIIIGETGWQDGYDAEGIGHQVNQAMYYEKMKAWVDSGVDSPTAIFYFEAFDEPWKQTDDHWGFFNTDREAKYIVYSNTEWSGLGFTNDVATVDELDGSEAVFSVPLPPLVTVSDSTFIVFGDDITTGYDAQVAGGLENLVWEPWGDCTVTGDYVTEEAQETGDVNVMEVTPGTATENSLYGWGMMAYMRKQGFDLSAFSAGHLTFNIRTAYSGKLRMGIQTGLAKDSDGWDLLIEVDPASNSYGYNNDDTWHTVSIPISTLVSAASLGYNQDATTSATLAKVYIPFVIADNKSDALDNAPIYVDKIRWTTN